MLGEHLDLTSDVPGSLPRGAGQGGAAAGGFVDSAEQVGAGQGRAGDSRKFVGVRFECCAIYTRVYVNRDGSAYEGRCPRCARGLRLEIGPGGTDSRFFSAY